MNAIEKDELYEMLIGSPDKQQFADILKGHEYEKNSIDFKETWIEKGKLAKIILAMANSGGGCIVFGIKETESQKGEPIGLSEECIRDESDVANSVKKYLPENVSWKLHTFSYDGSDYAKMSGKTFQVIVVYDTPHFIPFISINEGEDLKPATIYARRNTECVIANNSELQVMLNRRIETQYISKIAFAEHLHQLSELYKYHHDINTNPFAKLSYFMSYQSQDFSKTIDLLIKEKERQIRKIMGLE